MTEGKLALSRMQEASPRAHKKTAAHSGWDEPLPRPLVVLTRMTRGETMGSDHGAERRKVLGFGVAVLGGALARPAGAQQKLSKTQAQYQDKPKDGAQCDGCAHFIAPSGCKLVDGTISPKGWCMLFVKKPG